MAQQFVQKGIQDYLEANGASLAQLAAQIQELQAQLVLATGQLQEEILKRKLPTPRPTQLR